MRKFCTTIALLSLFYSGCSPKIDMRRVKNDDEYTIYGPPDDISAMEAGKPAAMFWIGEHKKYIKVDYSITASNTFLIKEAKGSQTVDFIDPAITFRVHVNSDTAELWRLWDLRDNYDRNTADTTSEFSLEMIRNGKVIAVAKKSEIRFAMQFYRHDPLDGNRWSRSDIYGYIHYVKQNGKLKKKRVRFGGCVWGLPIFIHKKA